MQTHQYNGLRRLLFSDKEYDQSLPILNRKNNLKPQTLEHAFHLLKDFDKKFLIISSDDETGKMQQSFTLDDYKGYVFISGKLMSIKDDHLELAHGLGKERCHLWPLKNIYDIISIEHIESKSSENSKFRIFTFHSLGHDKNGHDIYKILSEDPAKAYVQAKNTYNIPLRLSYIEELRDGMQFNKGRGEGKLEDLM